MKTKRFQRYDDISGKDVKRLVREGKLNEAKKLVPAEIHNYLTRG